MILVIDIGNSNIVFGFYQDNKLIKVLRTQTIKHQTVDEFMAVVMVMTQANNVDLSLVKGGMMASVVPNLTRVVVEGFKRLVGVEVMVLGPGVKTGLKIEIDEPHELGSDLVAGAIGAIESYPVPLVVVDLGTATTFGVIDDRKAFIGGIIQPGINISLQALIKQTSLLPDVLLKPSPSVIAKNTTQAIQVGLIDGAASSIEGIVMRIEDALKQSVTVVLTGGLSPIVATRCNREIILDEHLLLHGLYRIYQKNN